MSKEFIENRVDMAHNAIDEGDPQAAVNILRNLKLRIHDVHLEEEIKKFEKKEDTRFENKLEEINKSGRDPLRKDRNKQIEIIKYAKRYLNFYDRLRKEHDIY